ncbi:MAG TPA: hypothetical protein PLO71_12095, partial [Thauera phenylacetica]|nr:hypothetical protein [Thauera phenylacetica]
RSTRVQNCAAAFAPAGAPTATTARPGPACRSCGSCEPGAPALDARAELRRRLRACRRSYSNHRSSRTRL